MLERTLNLGAFIVIALTIMTSIVWTQFLGAPWVPTSMRMVLRMLEMAEVEPGDLVYDLGCGDGRMVITAARRFGANAVGIEVDPIRYLWCRTLVSVLRLQDQVKIVYGDFFSKDLSAADVVTCFLLQETNDRLEDKLKQELKSGTRVISNQFTFSGLRLVQQDDEARLYRIVPEDLDQLSI